MNRRTAMDVLVALVRGSAPKCEINGDEWASLIRLARRHKVLWVLKARIESLRIQLPFIAHHRLLRAERQDAAANLQRILALRELLRAMAVADVKIAPLKGPAMLERLYGDASKRTCTDLDVLIRLEDLERCNAVMLALGYAEEWVGEPYKWTWNRGAIKIEVHSDFEERSVLTFPMAPVWKRVHASEFQGQPAWQISAADELAFLCLHAVRHQFDSLSLIVELQRAFDLLGEALGGELPDWHESRTLPGVLLLAKAMIEHLMEIKVDMNVTVDARVQEKIPAMVNSLWTALMRQEPPPRTSFGAYRFLRQVEPRWTTRTKSLFKLSWMCMNRISVDDVASAKSLGVSGKWGRLCVRQMRLLVKGVHLLVKR